MYILRQMKNPSFQMRFKEDSRILMSILVMMQMEIVSMLELPMTSIDDSDNMVIASGLSQSMKIH